MGGASNGSASVSLTAVHVLVVDDSPEVLETLVEMLETTGARVSAVGTAHEALALVQQLRPDVLLSDFEMPEHDGLWLIDQVRKLSPEHGGSTPAACLTALTGPEDVARVLRAGFQYHVSKPVDLDQLWGIVAILALKP
jgi:CheY-like chemotaxis protein